MFGRTRKTLGKFFKESARNLQLSYENNIRDHIIYTLVFDGPNELQQCILFIGSILCAKSCSCLNGRFPNLPVFNATKFFSPRNYPSNDSDRITNTELWFESIWLKFHYIEEESDICKGELLEFMETL